MVSELENFVGHRSFVKESSKHLYSQTVKARELTLLEKVHLPPHIKCKLTHVTCHMSHDKCNMSRVLYNNSFFYKVGDLVGGGFVINEAYPV